MCAMRILAIGVRASFWGKITRGPSIELRVPNIYLDYPVINIKIISNVFNFLFHFFCVPSIDI